MKETLRGKKREKKKKKSEQKKIRDLRERNAELKLGRSRGRG